MRLLFISCLCLGILSCSKKESDKKRDLYFEVGQQLFAPGATYTAYYKNYEKLSLNTTESITGPMFVQGDDVYLPTSSGYLKNGALVPLREASVIYSIYVKDGDVYAAGDRKPYGASYWKNGQLFKLEPDSSEYAITAGKILVADNGDICVGGVVRYERRPEVIAYWKNGTQHELGEGTFTDMALSGTDVHIVGTQQNEGAYWINGIKLPLTGADGKRPGLMTSVSIWNGDVYLTGRGALYWKNGIPVGPVDAGATPQGLVVNNHQVYVAINNGLYRSSGYVYRMMLQSDSKTDTFMGMECKFICLGK